MDQPSRHLLVKNFKDLVHPLTSSLRAMGAITEDVDALVISDDPEHPANHICTLCANFYKLGWVCVLSAIEIEVEGPVYRKKGLIVLID